MNIYNKTISSYPIIVFKDGSIVCNNDARSSPKKLFLFFILVGDCKFVLASKPRFVLGKSSPVGEIVENCIVRVRVHGVDVEVGVEVGVRPKGASPLSLSSSRAADQDKALAALSRWDCLKRDIELVNGMVLLCLE